MAEWEPEWPTTGVVAEVCMLEGLLAYRGAEMVPKLGVGA